MKKQCRLSLSLVFKFWDPSMHVLYLGLGSPHVGCRSTTCYPDRKLHRPMFGGSVGPQQGGTTMRISKLLSMDGYNGRLWDMNFPLRKSNVSAEEIPGGPMKVERGQVFLMVLQSLPRLTHVIYSKNEFHSQLECLVSAGSIAFYPLPTALMTTFPLNSSNSKAEGGMHISSPTFSVIPSVFLKAAPPK